MKTIRFILSALVILLTAPMSSCRKEINPTPVVGMQQDSLSMGSLTLRHFRCEDPKRTLAYGLVAWYPFSGNADDWSGHGYNGTVFDAALTTGKSGCKNSAYNFNGYSSHIDLPFSMGDSVKQFSVYARVKSTSTGTLWDSGYEPGDYCSFKIAPGSVAYDAEETFPFRNFQKYLVHDISQGAVSPETPVETWNDVVVNFNNGTLTVYVNETPVNMTYFAYDDAGLGRFVPPDIYGVRIGAHFNVKSAVLLGIPFVDYLTGAVDELRFYNRLLTKAEIDYLYKH